MYWVLTPENETSMTRPGPSTLRVDDSGRRLAVQRDLLGSHADGDLALVSLRRARWARRCACPATSTVIAASVVPATSPVNRFDWPRKFATNTVRGSS